MIVLTLLAIGACQGTVGLLASIPIYKFWSRHRRVTPRCETVASEALENLDSPSDEPEQSLVSSTILKRSVLQRRKRVSYVARCAKDAQVEFGLLKPTDSNRLMVQRYLRDLMLSHNVRRSAIASSLPLAINLVFVPNQYHIEADQVLSSAAVQNRMEIHRSQWASGLLGIFRQAPLRFSDS